MSIEWPAGMPGKLLRDGWGMTPQSPLKRTEMDDGSVAVTRRFHRVRTTFQVRWDMTPVQFEVFKDFWLRDLDGGRAWFDAPVFTGTAEETLTVRFARIDPPWEAVSPRPGLIEVRAELEIADLPALSDEDRATLEGQL